MTEIVIRIRNQVKVYHKNFYWYIKDDVRFSILFEQLLLWNIYRVTQYGERKYIYFIKYIIIYNKFNYIFYILYIHSYCLMINPTVFKEWIYLLPSVFKSNKYLHPYLVYTVIHICIYIYHILHTFLYISYQTWVILFSTIISLWVKEKYFWWTLKKQNRAQTARSYCQIE